ncbi:MAG: trypsin-like peptidase domain-containing protein, partial [Pseudomonadota bacterium]
MFFISIPTIKNTKQLLLVQLVTLAAAMILLPLLVFASQPPASFAPIIKPLMPAVVNISTKQKVGPYGNSPFPPGSVFEEFKHFFDRFGMPPGMEFDYRSPRRNPKNGDGDDELKLASLGSGFIIDPTGYVVTNHHVVDGADEIIVNLGNQPGKEQQFTAKLIGSDSKTDIALLKIETKKPLPAVKFADSNRLQVGDWIIAIGNPFNLGGSVTTGIVSALSRNIGQA